jgi:N-acetylgalactosamine-N,N'-diacetylbacillosaminyl-diphospho-undecaprenol 4-alpha-N-acetylgalactosaminyltransferase
MKKLSILIYSLSGGGAERVVSILLNELKNRYDIQLVLMNETITYDIPSDIKICFLEKSNSKEHGILKLLKLPVLGWKYRNFCKKNSIDTSLSFMNRPNFINLFGKLFGSKAKTFISERTASSWEYPSCSPKDRVSRFLIGQLYPKADLIIPNARAIKGDLEKNFSINARFQVIHNPLDIHKVETLAKETVNFDFSRFTFVTVGRLHPQKNHSILIMAFAKLTSQSNQLIILGDGPLKESLQQMADKFGVSGRVFFLGFQDNPYKYLSKSDCFVFSSDHEGFPNALVEALACGLSVISTDCQSGPREILGPGSEVSYQLKDTIEYAKYGMLVPVGNKQLLVKAMEQVQADAKIKTRYARQAKKRAEDFAKEKIIKQYIEVLDELKFH